MIRARRIAISLGIVGLALMVLYQAAQYSFRLTRLPDGLDVWRIVHVSEKVYGFGPGGNETGVVVYALPRRTAEDIATGGLAWLDALPRGQQAGRGTPGAWQATPVPPDAAEWADPARCDWPGTAYDQSCPGLALLLKRYGFGIPLDADMEQLVNDALFSPGAYWTLRSTGLVLVIPAKRRVVFAYAG